MIHSINKTHKTSLPQMTVDAISAYLGVTEDLINNVYVYTKRPEQKGQYFKHTLHITPPKFINSLPMKAFHIQTESTEGWETTFTTTLLTQMKQSGIKSSKFVVIEDEYRLERADRLSKVMKMLGKKTLVSHVSEVFTEFAPQIQAFHEAVDRTSEQLVTEAGVEVTDQEGMPRLPIENIEDSTE